MEVVFDMLSGTSILFCTNIKSHYYDDENEVAMAMNFECGFKCKEFQE